MKKKQIQTQIILISIGDFLIFITYFYYPYLKRTEFNEKKIIEDNLNDKTSDETDSSFKNVEYKGLYNLDKTFSVNSEKAHILKGEPDIVHMTKMHVVLYLDDGKKVDITSDKGRYNKINYECFFEDNVRAVDEVTKIFSDNLDLLSTEDSVKIYNNVIINYPTGSLSADKVDYDFETKYFRISMFDDKAVKVKIFK